jgi:hypothetical protein
MPADAQRAVKDDRGADSARSRSRTAPRAECLGLIAGYAAPYDPRCDPGPEQHIDVDRPSELVGITYF